MPPVSIFTSHGLALAQIAANARTRPADIADALGIRERAAQRIVADLIDAGYVTRVQQGRRSVYALSPQLPFTFTDARRAIQLGSLDGTDTGAAPTAREQARAKLLAAAERLIDHGPTYFELSVEELISEAGFSRSTFYAYFQDTERLLEALLKDVFVELAEAATAYKRPPTSTDKNDLRAAISTIVTTYRKHSLVLATASQAASDRVTLRGEYRRLMDETTDVLRQHIIAGQLERFIRPELDPTRTATLVTWGTERTLSRVPRQQNDEQVERLISGATDLIWELLYAGPHNGTHHR